MARETIDIRAVVTAARDARGWSNYQLARAAGRQPWEVTRYLEHGRDIRTATLEPILAALGIEMSGGQRQ